MGEEWKLPQRWPLRRAACCLTLAAGLIVGLTRPGSADGIAPPRVVDDRLSIQLVAAEPDIVTPVGVSIDAKGRVLVIESHSHFRPAEYAGPPADRILMFEDVDGDGLPERRTIFFEGFQATMSIACEPAGSVLVATRGQITRLTDTDGDGRADEQTLLVRHVTAGDYPHNGLSGLVLDFRGDFYFGQGENLGADYSLVGTDGSTASGGGEGGNIYHCRADGTQLRRVATGFWNPFALATDCFERIFAVDNDPDSRPPCRLLHVIEGGDYGYRYRNGRKGVHPFTAWNGELPGTLPMVAGTGEAPSGIVAYESDSLPADYRGQILGTSWGDHRLERFALEPRGGSFQAVAQSFVEGGEEFRPVGIAVGRDGSLFVSDWVDKSYDLHGKGRLWRIAAKDAKPTRPTEPAQAILSADRVTRERAARAVANQTALEPFPLEQTILHAIDPRVRACAWLAIVAAGNGTPMLGRSLWSADSVDLKQLVIRSWPLDRRGLPVIHNEYPLPAETEFASQPEQIAVAWLESKWPVAMGDVRRSVTSPDPFVRSAARQRYRRDASLDDVLALGRSSDAGERLAAVLILRAMSDERAKSAAGQFLKDPDQAVSIAAIQWIGEDGLTQYRGSVVSLIEQGTVPRDVFENCLAAIEWLDRLKKQTIEISGADYIATLLDRADVGPALRRRALSMLPADHPWFTAEHVRGLLASDDVGIQVEAVRALRESALVESSALLAEMASDVKRESQVRAEAIVGLSADASDGQELLLRLAADSSDIVAAEALRSLQGASLSSSRQAELRGLGQARPALADLVARLLKPVPQNGASHTGTSSRTDLAHWLAIADGPADPAAGGRVFFQSRGAACARCHCVGGRGGRVGPDLSNVGRVLSRQRLVESLVDPSKEIAPQFVCWAIARADGTTATGVLVSQDALGTQTYADAEGKLFTVRKDELDQRAAQTKSIMPDGLVDQLTPQEFRDLVAFLTAPDDAR